MRNSNCFLHCICLFPLFVQRCLFFLLNQVTKREEIKTKEIQLVQTFFFFLVVQVLRGKLCLSFFPQWLQEKNFLANFVDR